VGVIVKTSCPTASARAHYPLLFRPPRRSPRWCAAVRPLIASNAPIGLMLAREGGILAMPLSG